MTFPETRSQVVDMQTECPFASPKRIRRRSEKIGDEVKMISSSLSPEGSGSTGSNSVVLSPDASGPEPPNHPTNIVLPVDQMDID
jgi:hypothetical protein